MGIAIDGASYSRLWIILHFRHCLTSTCKRYITKR